MLFPIGKRAMASASVSSVSGITAVLKPNGVEFKALTVLKFRYEEQLGQPFKIEIELECTNEKLGTLSPNNVVGRDLLVTISDGQPIRYFHAIMETFTAIDNHGAFNRYRGTAVPWYSLLKLAEDSRIHTYTPKEESLDVGTLLENICKGFGFVAASHALRVPTKPEPPVKPGDNTKKEITRTQYCETYFQFLQRLLQQEGWYYYWTHESDKHTMNTTAGSDTPPNFTNAKGHEYTTIKYEPFTGGNAATECIYEWSHEAAVQPVNFKLSDYNYSTSETELADHSDSHYPSSFKELCSKDPFKNLVISRHPGHFSKKGDGTSGYLVKQLMQQFECRQAFIRGKAASVGLAVGHKFKPSWRRTDENPYSPDGQEYLTTKITLQIVRPHDESTHRKSHSIDCEFAAIQLSKSGTSSYRPIYNVTEPRIFGVQSAVVCAATGGSKESEEHGEPPKPDDHSEKPISCDYSKEVDSDTKSGPYGRVQVKFHWCRGKNERTDWIRLTHLMAGNGWGEFHLPRPGDEVLVAFEHGDPDRPVIVGCLYNNNHAMPFDLSDTKDGENLKKLFAIKDPGGNLFIMDPGDATSETHELPGKKQTISLYSPSTKHPSSVQIGQNDENWPGKPHH